jgi:hypothetical protein
MPSGTGDGIVHSLTFTPAAAGRLVVTVTYDCQGDLGDSWGASYLSKTFCAQDGSTVYGEASPMTTSRLSQTARGVFDVVASEEVECGLYGDISGAVTATWWNVNITAELIKR